MQVALANAARTASAATLPNDWRPPAATHRIGGRLVHRVFGGCISAGGGELTSILRHALKVVTHRRV